MSTNCWIARKTQKGYEVIYCHWDGYPERVGRILKQYYSDPKKLRKLFALGDISSLRKDIGKYHPFDYDIDDPKYKNMTTAYHRDRGDPWPEVKPTLFKSFVALLDKRGPSISYLYVFEKGKWTQVK
jgi:hypothetical protein